jgi:hypothetical protein
VGPVPKNLRREDAVKGGLAEVEVKYVMAKTIAYV